MPLLDARPSLPPGLVVDAVETGIDRIIIFAHPAATVSACLACSELSRRIHSRYQRRLLDLPARGRVVELHLQVRRFRCAKAECLQRTFAESLPAEVARRFGQHTSRLDGLVQHLGMAAVTLRGHFAPLRGHWAISAYPSGDGRLTAAGLNLPWFLRAFFGAPLGAEAGGGMEIITGVERRRRWRPEEKLRILAELDEPGAKFAEVARRH